MIKIIKIGKFEIAGPEIKDKYISIRQHYSENCYKTLHRVLVTVSYGVYKYISIRQHYSENCYKTLHRVLVTVSYGIYLYVIQLLFEKLLRVLSHNYKCTYYFGLSLLY